MICIWNISVYGHFDSSTCLPKHSTKPSSAYHTFANDALKGNEDDEDHKKPDEGEEEHKKVDEGEKGHEKGDENNEKGEEEAKGSYVLGSSICGLQDFIGALFFLHPRNV